MTSKPKKKLVFTTLLRQEKKRIGEEIILNSKIILFEEFIRWLSLSAENNWTEHLTEPDLTHQIIKVFYLTGDSKIHLDMLKQDLYQDFVTYATHRLLRFNITCENEIQISDNEWVGEIEIKLL